MYLNYWQLKSKPFENDLDSDFYFSASQYSEAYAKLSYFLEEKKEIAVLTGHYGTGKTFLMSQLLNKQSQQHFKFLMVTINSRIVSNIYKAILRKIDHGYISDKDEQDRDYELLLDRLDSNIRNGCHNVLVIEEAQLISNDTIFEDLRLLINSHQKVGQFISLIFVGHSSFTEQLRHFPQLNQWISIRTELNALNAGETREYIRFRLKSAGAIRDIFSEEAIDLIHKTGEGIPRRINNICDLCMVTATLKKCDLIDQTIVESAFSGNERIFMEKEEKQSQPVTIVNNPVPIAEHQLETANTVISLSEQQKPTSSPFPPDEHDEKESKRKQHHISIDRLMDWQNGLYQNLKQAFNCAKNNEPIDLDIFDNYVNDLISMSIESEDILYSALDPCMYHSVERHCINTAIIACHIGIELGLDNKMLYKIIVTSLFHDIGLMKLPHSLVYNKGVTDKKDIEMLKKHPHYGATIVQSMHSAKFGKDLKWLAETILQEHEREGGIGYPFGLKGEDISETAKIIGLADVFEAACHRRKHRKSTLVYESIRKIIDLNESYFSTRLKKALLKPLSLFPKGTFVKLNSGEIGKVVEINHVHPMRPLVKILFDSQKNRLPEPEQRHLRDIPYLHIKDVIDEEDLKES